MPQQSCYFLNEQPRNADVQSTWRDQIRSIQTDSILNEFFKLKPDKSHPNVQLLRIANDLKRNRKMHNKLTLEKLIADQERLLKAVRTSRGTNPNFKKLSRPEYLNLGYSLLDAIKKAQEDLETDRCDEILKGAS